MRFKLDSFQWVTVTHAHLPRKQSTEHGVFSVFYKIPYSIPFIVLFQEFCKHAKAAQAAFSIAFYIIRIAF